jgi:hypothetical protein
MTDAPHHGPVDFGTFVVGDIPGLFGITFTMATVYYKLLSGTKGFLGQGLILKKPD